MDLALFHRSKGEFWAWVVGPPLLIGCLYVSFFALCRCGEIRIAGRLAFMESLPRVEASLDAARAEVDRFKSDDSEPHSAGDLAATVHTMADTYGYTVNSLRTGEPEPGGGAVALSTLTIKGVGSLAVTAAFVDALQGGEGLMSVTQAKLASSKLGEEVVYSSEILVKCCSL